MPDTRRIEELIEKLFARADELRDGHSEIKQQIAEGFARMESIGKQAATAHEVVLGNGTPDKGLAAQTAALKNRVEKLENSEDSRKWGVRIALGAVILGAGKWVAAKLGLPI